MQKAPQSSPAQLPPLRLCPLPFALGHPPGPSAAPRPGPTHPLSLAQWLTRLTSFPSASEHPVLSSPLPGMWWGDHVLGSSGQCCSDPGTGPRRGTPRRSPCSPCGREPGAQGLAPCPDPGELPGGNERVRSERGGLLCLPVQMGGPRRQQAWGLHVEPPGSLLQGPLRPDPRLDPGGGLASSRRFPALPALSHLPAARVFLS